MVMASVRSGSGPELIVPIEGRASALRRRPSANQEQPLPTKGAWASTSAPPNPAGRDALAGQPLTPVQIELQIGGETT